MARTAAPSHESMRCALALACRAPSVHNSQPWLWDLSDHAAHLYVDRTRLLTAVDPDGREMVISCGAALHHARLAFAADGWRPTVHRLPNPAHPNHLASIEFSRLPESDPNAVALAAIAPDRHTDRRPFLPDAVPSHALSALCDVAGAQGSTLTFASDDQSRRELEIALEYAGQHQRQRPDYNQELALWARRHASDEGVPAHNITDEHVRGMPSRDFGTGELAVPVLDDGAVLGVLATSGDTMAQWLSAGEALSAVLLAATQQGLATCPLSQISEVKLAREQVRDGVLGTSEAPQVAVRVGWPVTGEYPTPPTPRRPVADVVHLAEPP